jgi:hypothetical protein
MMSQNKIREFSRKIFHGLGYPTATSLGPGLGPGPDHPRDGPTAASGAHLDLRGGTRSASARAGDDEPDIDAGEGEGRVRVRIPKPMSPKRLTSPENRVRSAQARDFFDLQQFILELWTGITVKVTAGGEGRGG